MHFCTKAAFIYSLFFAISITSCEHLNKNSARIQQKLANQININPMFQLELSDSSKLTHIKGLFYRTKDGHLYEKTVSDREIDGVETLVTVEYFNGQVPQYIDPLTFRILGGWYATDRHFVYYYRPTSGGMVARKIQEADLNTFNIIKGQYKFATDKNHVFKEATILNKLKPANLKITTNENGEILKLISDNISYTNYD